MKKNYYGVNIGRVPVELKELKTIQTLCEDIATEASGDARDIDVYEAEAIGSTYFMAILSSMLDSIDCRIACDENGNIICLFGISEDSEKNHIIWMMATRHVERHHKALVAAGMDYIRENLDKYGFLYNYISKKNERAIRFIKKAGALFGPAFMLQNGESFMKFYLKKEEPCAPSVQQ